MTDLSLGTVDYQNQSDTLAQSTGILIETGSNYFLPVICNMLYEFGIYAAVLMLIF